MWAFCAFVILGLTPFVWPAYETQILYWSNFLQLIFLPVITVGTAIMSRRSAARAAADHATITEGFAILRDTHAEFGKSLTEIGRNVEELLRQSKRAWQSVSRWRGRRRALRTRALVTPSWLRADEPARPPFRLSGGLPRLVASGARRALGRDPS